MTTGLWWVWALCIPPIATMKLPRWMGTRDQKALTPASTTS